MSFIADVWNAMRGWARARAQFVRNRELHEENRAKALLKAKELIENTPIVPDQKREHADATKIRQFCESKEISPQTKRQVLEAMPLQPDWVTPWQDWLSSLQFDGTYWPVITGLTGRKEGSAFPFFRSEGELMILRDMSRALCKVNNHASGMISAFRSYVIRQGYTCTITDKDGKDPELQKQVQTFVDAYYRKNMLKERQKEAFDRSVRDGEVFLRNFPNSDGDRIPIVRFVWSEQIKQPIPEDRNYWYGVLTAENDIETVLEYAVHNLDGSTNYERVSPKDIVHIKRNVDSGVKRGIPDFCWGLHDAIRQAGKLEGNLGEGSAIQAAIAYVLQYAAGMKSEIEQASTAQSDYSAGRPWQQNSVRDVQQFEPGMIVHTSKNEQFLPGPINAGISGHLEVVTLLLRSAAVRWNAPEWLVSADSTSSNYASSLVAESPFILRIEDEQTKYLEAYTRLVTRAIEMGMEAGLLPGDALRRIEVKLEAPSAVVRNKLEEAQTDAQRLQQKTKSPQQSIREQGFKPEEVAKEWQEWAQLLPSTPAPGQPGQETPGDDEQGKGGLLATALGKGEEDRATPTPESLFEATFDEDKHPRDDHGRFVGHEELAQARSDPKKAEQLRSHVTNPEERKKLEGRTAESVDSDSLSGRLAQLNEYGSNDDWQSLLLEDGFTGTITDKAGRKRYYQDGKPVANPQEQQTPDNKPAAQPKQPKDASSHTDEKMKSFAARIAEVPKQIVDKVGGFVQKRFEALTAKYGKTGARLIVAGMIALAPTPIPGSSLIPVALASVIKRLFGGSKKETQESMDQSLPTGEELVAAIREALAALYAEAGEQAPEISDDDVKAFLAEYQQHVGESEQVQSQGVFLLEEAAFDSAKHPRDDKGRFVSHGDMKAAMTDPAKAEQLRKRVTNPTERKKLEAALGGGGAKKTKRAPEKNLSAVAAKAKAAHKMVDKGIQQYAEEHNEPAFAKSMGGVSFPNGEPIDVAIPGADGKVAHGVELKTMVDNSRNKIDMNTYAQIRKLEWEREQGATFHTVVLDDQDAYSPDGNHDLSKRRMFYRRGVGSFRVEGMHPVKDLKELKTLMATPDAQLPQAAQRTDGDNRIGRWKFFTDAEGKGYKNSKTGRIVRPKK